MRTNWLSRLTVKYRRAYEPRNRADVHDVDARRVRSELDAIRVRFPDHA
jgi:hypothetical protein